MSQWYQETHGPQLDTRPLAWGQWAVPESEVGALREVASKSVLELGCGGGQWSMFLAEVGARPVGLDVAEEQLRAALRIVRAEVPWYRPTPSSCPSGPRPSISLSPTMAP